MKSSYGASLFGLTFRSRRKSEAARFKAQRGESDHGANNFGPNAAARADGSGGDLSQWIAMMSSENPAGSAQNSRAKRRAKRREKRPAKRPPPPTVPADALDVAGGDENVQLAENVAENGTDKETPKTGFSIRRAGAAPAHETPRNG